MDISLSMLSLFIILTRDVPRGLFATLDISSLLGDTLGHLTCSPVGAGSVTDKSGFPWCREGEGQD